VILLSKKLATKRPAIAGLSTTYPGTLIIAIAAKGESNKLLKTSTCIKAIVQF
jgi:hypothetical protein